MVYISASVIQVSYPSPGDAVKPGGWLQRHYKVVMVWRWILGQALKEWSAVPHARVSPPVQKDRENLFAKAGIPLSSAVMKSRLTRRDATLQKQPAGIGPINQGSVALQAPGSWRWPFKIKGKTACVALPEERAAQMSQAIDNHSQLERFVREMGQITQPRIPGTVPGVRGRKPLSEIPKARQAGAIRD